MVDKWGSEDAASRYGVPMNADADLAARLVVVDAARELVASGAAIEDVFALIRARTVGVIGPIWITMRVYGIGLCDAQLLVVTSDAFFPDHHPSLDSERVEIIARLGIDDSAGRTG
jgi:hypothetical protein